MLELALLGYGRRYTKHKSPRDAMWGRFYWYWGRRSMKLADLARTGAPPMKRTGIRLILLLVVMFIQAGCCWSNCPPSWKSAVDWHTPSYGHDEGS